MVDQRQMHTEYRSHLPVVSPALCSTHGSCNLDVPDIPPMYNYVVNDVVQGLDFGCIQVVLYLFAILKRVSDDVEIIFSAHS